MRGASSLRVDFVVASLELEGCADILASKISGGQRRRTSLGLELVHAPSVLLADEPTSGLDARAARLVIEKLKAMATTSRTTAICTIHQPSRDIFETFDKIIVLAGGRVCFVGHTQAAVSYFNYSHLLKPKHEALLGINSAEAILECVGDDANASGDAWRDHAADAKKKTISGDQATSPSSSSSSERNKSDDEDGYPNRHPKKKKPSAMPWIFSRAMTNTWRGVGTLQIRASAFVAFFISILFWREQDTQRRGQLVLGAYFLSAIFQGVFTVNSTITLVPSEVPTLRREYFNGLYTVTEYLIARLAVAAMLQFVSVLAYVSVFFPLIHRGGYGGDAEDKFLRCFWALLLLGLFANFVGVFIGSVAPNQTVATLAVSPAVVPPLMCAGYFFHKNDLTKSIQHVVYPFWYLSYLRYTFYILVVNEFRNGQFQVCDGEDYCPFNNYVVHPEQGVSHDVIAKEYLAIPQGTVLPFYYFILLGFIFGILVVLSLAVKYVTLRHD